MFMIIRLHKLPMKEMVRLVNVADAYPYGRGTHVLCIGLDTSCQTPLQAFAVALLLRAQRISIDHVLSACSTW